MIPSYMSEKIAESYIRQGDMESLARQQLSDQSVSIARRAASRSVHSDNMEQLASSDFIVNPRQIEKIPQDMSPLSSCRIQIKLVGDAPRDLFTWKVLLQPRSSSGKTRDYQIADEERIRINGVEISKINHYSQELFSKIQQTNVQIDFDPVTGPILNVQLPSEETDGLRSQL